MEDERDWGLNTLDFGYTRLLLYVFSNFYVFVIICVRLLKMKGVESNTLNFVSVSFSL